jgi:hypothetical protein
VYCPDPASEWWIVLPCNGVPWVLRNCPAWRSALSMNAVALLVEHSQPVMVPANASMTNAV